MLHLLARTAESAPTPPHPSPAPALLDSKETHANKMSPSVTPTLVSMVAHVQRLSAVSCAHVLKVGLLHSAKKMLMGVIQTHVYEETV